MLPRPTTRPSLAMVAALMALLLCATGSASAAKVVPRAKQADKAKNASRVNGLKASKTPKKGQLLALDKNGKFPASVLPANVFGQGAPGPVGPAGPQGATGTVDTSTFFTKADSDARFLAKAGKAADADLLDGRDSAAFLQVNPAARQDPAVTPLGTAALWLRPTYSSGPTTGTSEFKVDNDGGLLAAGAGAFGTGQIPATGCGVRLMWHPAKGALRAGSPGQCPGAGTAWDDANVGMYSWAGGNQSTASGQGSLAFGDQAVASGVVSNAFGSAVLASGTASFACCATSRAEGFASTALGYTNRATGQGATALGYRTAAIGDNSVALGYRAVTGAGCPTNSICDTSTLLQANGYSGSFVYGDESTSTSMAATADNQFSVRAAGGVRLLTNSALTTGCTLPAGSGVFSCTSDRHAKHDFEAVDSLSVLKRLSKVPVTTWRYKSEGGGVRHMGPTAQDFHAAFGLGPDDKTIGSIDEDGVNTAAIQALYDLSRRQQRQLDAQEARIARLERRLERQG
jgi:Head domain of trimeric autotransporter adhesin/Chaperone of endosialidase